MTLRSAAQEVRVPVAPNLGGSPKVAAQEALFVELFDRTKNLSVVDASALVARLRSATRQEMWTNISFSDWKNAAWVVLAGPEPLAAEPNFLERLLQEYRIRKKRSAYLGLILAYIRDFDPQNRAVDTIAREILAIVDQFDWKWSARHRKYGLFSPSDAPRRIARLCLWGAEEPNHTLTDAGMGAGRSFGGLPAHSYCEALKELRDALQKSVPEVAVSERVLRWSVDGGALIYPAHRAVLAMSLLLPWTESPPSDELKENISSFLLKYFHDPRLPTNAKDWIGVDEAAVAVLRKWLTGVALEQFFVVVDQVAKEHMWRFRRSFWLAYYNMDRIEDAWVLFGPDALKYARRAFGKSLSFGRLERSYQVQSDHSVLLMRIGRLTISEWSHNGRCFVWLNGNPKAPKLYRATYKRDDLILGSDNEGQAHHASEHGTWQRQVESYIRRHTGISVDERNYMPEGWRR